MILLIDKNKDITHFLNEGLIVDKDTGEIMTNKQYHETFSESLRDAIGVYISSCLTVEQTPKLELRTIKNAKCAVVPIKEKYYFNKVFRKDMQSIMMNGKLSKDELAIIGFMQNFITFPDNIFLVNGMYLTLEEISKISNINRNALAKALKSLENRQIIKMITSHKKAPTIYFNPFLISTGGVIAVETYAMFKNSVYNPKDYLDEVDE